ncbi:MAG: hypothetical protein AB9866_05530 [Syntrophobacteraceae bacterium]
MTAAAPWSLVAIGGNARGKSLCADVPLGRLMAAECGLASTSR